MRPFHPYRNLFADKTEKIELEFEEYFALYFFAGWSWPVAGDLLFASGRWIIDCGHTPYRSEIHPPAVMVHMRTEIHNGQPATEANIWVNGYFTGYPVDIEIVPPLRPSPTALLNIEKPVDSQATGEPSPGPTLGSQPLCILTPRLINFLGLLISTASCFVEHCNHIHGR